MVEWTALEMRRTGDCTLGSNPSLSASKAELTGSAFLFRDSYSLPGWVLAPLHYASVGLRPSDYESQSLRKNRSRSGIWTAFYFAPFTSLLA